MATIQARLRTRRGTAAQWISANPILGLGEQGWETDAVPAQGKVGDGVTAWNLLSYSLGNSNSASATMIDASKAPYNANPANTGDQTSAIQAAIDAAAAFTVSGLTDVYLPGGTYLFSGKIQVKSHVRLRGAGMGVTTLKSTSGAASQSLVEIVAAVDATIEDLTVDCNSRTNSIGIVLAPTGNVADRIATRRVRVINATNNALRYTASNGGTNWTIDGCIFQDCTNGTAVYPPGITGGVANGTTKGVRITNNTYINVGTNILHAGNSTVNHSISGVICTGNVLRDFQNVGANGPIPVEITWCDNVLIANNYIGSGGTRGLSTGQNYNMTITGNTVVGQSIYAMECGGNVRFSVTGNVFDSCASWIVMDGGTTASQDGVISGNSMIGTGLSASNGLSNNAIKMGDASKRITVSGNTFSDWQWAGPCIRLGVGNTCEDINITGNTFINNDVNSNVSAVLIAQATRSMVAGNVYHIKRNLVAGDDISDAVQVSLNASSSDITVMDNEVTYAGTTSAASNSSGVGHGSTGSATMSGLRVIGNMIKNGARGLRLGSLTSADAIVTDNDTRSCTAVDNFNAALIYKRTQRQAEATAIPTSGTWARGDIVWNNGTTAGNPMGWVCTVAGTPGTWAPVNNTFPAVGADAGLKVSNFAPDAVTTASGALTAGVAYVTRVIANQSGTSTSFRCYLSVSGVTLTNTYVAVYDSTGAQLAVSADQSTTMAAATGEKAITIPSVTLAAGQVYYLLFLNGSSATPPQLRGAAAAGLYGVNAINRLNTYLTGQTAAPASLTLGSLVSVASPFPWMALG